MTNRGHILLKVVITFNALSMSSNADEPANNWTNDKTKAYCPLRSFPAFGQAQSKKPHRLEQGALPSSLLPLPAAIPYTTSFLKERKFKFLFIWKCIHNQ